MPSPALLWFVGRALTLFVVIDLLLWWRGFQAAYDWTLRAGRLQRREPDEQERNRRVARTIRAVTIATRYYHRRRLDCLPRALTMYRLLKAQGVPARLCMGVKKFPFSGHAWVEVAGAVIDDSPTIVGRYTVLSKL